MNVKSRRGQQRESLIVSHRIGLDDNPIRACQRGIEAISPPVAPFQIANPELGDLPPGPLPSHRAGLGKNKTLPTLNAGTARGAHGLTVQTEQLFKAILGAVHPCVRPTWQRILR